MRAGRNCILGLLERPEGGVDCGLRLHAVRQVGGGHLLDGCETALLDDRLVEGGECRGVGGLVGAAGGFGGLPAAVRGLALGDGGVSLALGIRRLADEVNDRVGM
ncbi:MAG: hypothetical protein ABSC06_22715 [Rhodopila sp.]